MSLNFPSFALGDWVRTCQECGHKQKGKNPQLYKGDSWRDTKCRKCHSEGSLDYGQENCEETEDEE